MLILTLKKNIFEIIKMVLMIIFFHLIFSCNNSSETKQIVNSDSSSKQISAKTELNNLFSMEDAERILGEKVIFSDSSTNYANGVLRYQWSYRGIVEGKLKKYNKREANIYGLIELYDKLPDAERKYTSIKTANEYHGIEVLEDLGDEAYFHTDTVNFYFVMVRKGKYVFNMKVSKITDKTSVLEFNSVARRMTSQL